MPESKGLVYVGVISGASGIKGDAIVKSHTANPEDIFIYKLSSDRVFKNSDISTEKTKEKKTEGDQREYDNNFKIKKVRVKSNGSFVVRIKNCNTRNDAEAIIGTRLYTLKSELPKPKDGEFYIHNLVGKKLIDSNEKNIGTIKNILNYGAGDIIEIKLHDQKETILLPFDNEHFSDIEEGHIKIIQY